MIQLINEPTHFTETSHSLIDLFLVSSACSVPFLDQNFRFHCPVYCCLNCSKPYPKKYKRNIWKFDQGDYDNLRREAASINWDSLADDDINAYVENITVTILSISKKHVPNTIATIRQSDPAWMYNDVRKHVGKRKRAYDRAKRTQNERHWNIYKQIRKKTTQLLRNAKTQLSVKLSNKLKTENLKISDHWKILKQFISPSKNTSVPLLNDNGTLVTEDTDKANLLNNFFQSQTLLDDNNKTLPHMQTNTNHPQLNTIIITEEEVTETLKSLTVGKAAGPDNVNNRILKELSQELARPLCHLFNISISTGQMPSKWKLAHVCAVFKKNDPQLVSNYRPISLLSTISKVVRLKGRQVDRSTG
ncbi:uncharacterized protein LOC128555668 [Mercenaria mercenaria]|uniref:uncharacterized protein LOC128555668 n=1 Tax=Mercenaria mercenaria TaxID=6596 RepID=UPI00234ED31D|nr:uncharacterized protein LOC128555668 [Mercenaria mercenaria]